MAGGFSQTRLGRMRSVLTRHVEHEGVPGVVALVSRHGEMHVEAIGALADGNSAPMRRDSIFRIASMTKPVTAVAALILVEECRLRLDDPVDRLLPELANRRVLTRIDAPLDETVPAARPITLRDLLTFTLGFGIIFAPPGTYPVQRALEPLQLNQGMPAPDGVPAPDEWLRRFATLPLLHQPGERWMYNTGSDVLGVVIARAAGQPFEKFLQERIFAPLGMNDTAFFVPPAKRDRFTTCYWTDMASGARVQYDAPDGQWSRPPDFPAGAAGLVSTVDDYFAFAQMLLNGGSFGGERILSRTTVDLMSSDQITPAQKAASEGIAGFFDTDSWGFGVSVVTRKTQIAQAAGCYGWNGGMGTSWANDPREGLVGIVLTQRSFDGPQGSAVVHDFWTTAYQALDA